MSRLIDADRLLQETWKVETKDMFHITEMVEVVSAIDIKEAPTVEAIPIEWLEKAMGNGVFRDAIYYLIEGYRWEKENEKSGISD